MAVGVVLPGAGDRQTGGHGVVEVRELGAGAVVGHGGDVGAQELGSGREQGGLWSRADVPEGEEPQARCPDGHDEAGVVDVLGLRLGR